MRNKLEKEHLEANFRVSTTPMGVMELRSHKTEFIQRWRNIKMRRSGSDKGDILISSRDEFGEN